MIFVILEAIEAILRYSASVDELLHRQKLKKDHLKEYLVNHIKKSLLPLVVNADKEALIQLAKETWIKDPSEKVFLRK